MAKQLREKGITLPKFRRPVNSSYSSRSNNGAVSHRGGRGGMNSPMMDRGSSLRGRNKVFMKNKIRLNNGPINKKSIYNRMIPGHRFGGSTTAAAEAYVADYMRTMQHQLPPMPYVPPSHFGSSLPPPLPRYYDGLPAIPDYPPPPIGNRQAPSNYGDKRSYDEFMWKNKNRNAGRDSSRDSRDSYRSGGDKHRNYRR